MSGQQPDHIKVGIDDDNAILDRSWGAQSRLQLQEEGLKLVGSSRRAKEIEKESGDALLNVHVELGLLELTAALGSLR